MQRKLIFSKSLSLNVIVAGPSGGEEVNKLQEGPAMADPNDMIDPDADVVRTLQPKGVVRMLFGPLRAPAQLKEP